jgi:hypothetical protein
VPPADVLGVVIPAADAALTAGSPPTLSPGSGDASSRAPGGCPGIERAFAWLGRNRRLSKDYEYKVQTSETLIGIAATRLMAQPLGCVIRLLAHPLSHSALIDAHLFEEDLRGANPQTSPSPL